MKEIRELISWLQGKFSKAELFGLSSDEIIVIKEVIDLIYRKLEAIK